MMIYAGEINVLDEEVGKNLNLHANPKKQNTIRCAPNTKTEK
jgi:hypothetical protein